MVQNFGWLQLNILIATLFAKVYFILHSVHHIIFYGFEPSKKTQTSGFVLLSLKVESLQFAQTIIRFFDDISPPTSDVQS